MLHLFGRPDFQNTRYAKSAAKLQSRRDAMKLAVAAVASAALPATPRLVPKPDGWIQIERRRDGSCWFTSDTSGWTLTVTTEGFNSLKGLFYRWVGKYRWGIAATNCLEYETIRLSKYRWEAE